MPMFDYYSAGPSGPRACPWCVMSLACACASPVTLLSACCWGSLAGGTLDHPIFGQMLLFLLMFGFPATSFAMALAICKFKNDAVTMCRRNRRMLYWATVVSGVHSVIGFYVLYAIYHNPY